MSLLTAFGLSATAAASIIAAGALLDIGLGVAVLIRRYTRVALIAMLIVSGLYLAVASVVAPHLWADPLGSISKTLIVALATLFTLAVIEER